MVCLCYGKFPLLFLRKYMLFFDITAQVLPFLRINKV